MFNKKTEQGWMRTYTKNFYGDVRNFETDGGTIEVWNKCRLFK